MSQRAGACTVAAVDFGNRLQEAKMPNHTLRTGVSPWPVWSVAGAWSRLRQYAQAGMGGVART
jgi:hypothetical protein